LVLDRLQALTRPPLRFDKPRLFNLISLGSDSSIGNEAATEVPFQTLVFPSFPDETAVELQDAFANVDLRDPGLLGNLAPYRSLKTLALKRGSSRRLPKFLPGHGFSPLNEEEPLAVIEQQRTRNLTLLRPHSFSVSLRPSFVLG
jgi:hypothetical protein